MYLDDVIIFSKNVNEHIRHVDEVLTILRNAGISLKSRECEFFQRKVNYLGHVILPNKLAIAKDLTQGIRDGKFPEDMK